MAVHKRCGSGYFNPRSREGSDWRDQKWWNYVIISIRAPAKGATAIVAAGILVWKFQSALPRRERPEEWQAVDALAKFQSALPRRERQKNTVLPQKISNFNPRSREGSDFAFGYVSAYHSNFNPRSREGSDDLVITSSEFRFSFQSALPRRERL